MARYADWLDYGISRFWIEATVDFVRAISDGMIGVEFRHTNLIGTYKFRNSNKTFLSLGIFASRNPWYAFAKPQGSEETSLRNIALDYLQFRLYQLWWY